MSRSGIDVLEEHEFRELHPNREHPIRIGLVTNQTGIDARGQRTVDVLARVPGIRNAGYFQSRAWSCGINWIRRRLVILKMLGTGVPVYSVYGDTDAKRRPNWSNWPMWMRLSTTSRMWARGFTPTRRRLDISWRLQPRRISRCTFWIGPTRLAELMYKARLLIAGSESFVSYGQIPVRHGMTAGELARLFNGERPL